MSNPNYREIQLLALLYRVEELMLELQVGGKEYNDLLRIILKLKNELEGDSI
jgi:hypothetical protein